MPSSGNEDGEVEFDLQFFPRSEAELPPKPKRPFLFGTAAALAAYAEALPGSGVRPGYFSGLIHLNRHKAERELAVEIDYLTELARSARSARLWIGISQLHTLIAERCRLMKEGEDKAEPRLASIRCLEMAIQVEPRNVAAIEALGCHLIVVPDGRDLARGKQLLESIPKEQRSAFVQVQLQKLMRPKPGSGMVFQVDFDALVARQPLGFAEEAVAARAEARVAQMAGRKQDRRTALDALYRIGLLQAAFKVADSRQQERERRGGRNEKYLTEKTADEQFLVALVKTISSYSYSSSGVYFDETAGIVTARDWQNMADEFGPQSYVFSSDDCLVGKLDPLNGVLLAKTRGVAAPGPSNDYRWLLDSVGRRRFELERERARSVGLKGERIALDHLYRMAIVIEAQSAISANSDLFGGNESRYDEKKVAAWVDELRASAKDLSEYSYASHGRIEGASAKFSLGPRDFKAMERIFGVNPKTLDPATLIPSLRHRPRR